MNTNKTENRSNLRRITGAACKASVALAILATLLPLPASALLPSPANQTGLNGSGRNGAEFIEASGSFIDCSWNYVFRQAGPNIIVTGDLAQTNYGTLDGCWTGSERDVVFQNGSATFHGSGIFEGTVEGQSGTIVMSYEGIYDVQANVATAHWVLARGTDGLRNLHGEGTWSGTGIDPTSTPCTDPNPCEGYFQATYSGTLHFAP